MEYRYYDAHTHLNSEKMFDNYQEYIDKFVAIWWRALVNVWADHGYNENALTIARENTNEVCAIYTTLGLHPCEIESWEKNVQKTSWEEEQKFLLSEHDVQEEFLKLKKLVLENKKEIVAIGECGIDLHYVNTPENLALQKLLFQRQLDLARELDVPVVIHSRDAFKETLEILKDYTDLKIYVHCWGYGPEEVKTLLEIFPKVWIGFTGNVSYPKAQDIRESLAVVPRECLLLETDAPYLAPQKVRGKTNEPAFVQYVYQFVAEQLAVSEGTLAQQIEQNAKVLYSV